MAAASYPSPFFGIIGGDIRDQMKLLQQQQQQTTPAPSSSTDAPPDPPPQKKRRNQPGTPSPDAEVIALSPKSLMATNRFICEVCSKGFQREQNLQLHRRGHNLPWKLRQKSATEVVRRRVYLCPEPTCVHHDPSRALGDLTGIKKHFFRKHGEKKWKCDKCSKKYAVQSDWKAHSKTCGTREYRCDCGTLFSRRDSFITHRAFCDALAQESARLPAGLGALGSGHHIYGSSKMGLNLSQINSQISAMEEQNHIGSTGLLRLGAGDSGGIAGNQFDHLMSTATNPPSFLQPQPSPSSGFFFGSSNQDQFESKASCFHGLLRLPDVQTSIAVPPSSAATATNNIFNLGFFSAGNSNSNTAGMNSSSINSDAVNNLSTSLLFSNQFNSGGGGSERDALVSAGGNLQLMGDSTTNPSLSSIYSASMPSESYLPQMSATALLQKASQMGATTTTSSSSPSLLRGFGSTFSSTGGAARPTNFRDPFGRGDTLLRAPMENEYCNFHDLMNSLTSGGGEALLGGNNTQFGGGAAGQEQDAAGFGGFNLSLSTMDDANLHQDLTSRGSVGVSDRSTRDFLGVGGIARNMGRAMSQREQQRNLSVDRIDSLDSEITKSAFAGRSFTSGDLQ